MCTVDCTHVKCFIPILSFLLILYTETPDIVGS